MAEDGEGEHLVVVGLAPLDPADDGLPVDHACRRRQNRWSTPHPAEGTTERWRAVGGVGHADQSTNRPPVPRSPRAYPPHVQTRIDRGRRGRDDRHGAGGTTAMVASSSDHVDAINTAVQTARIAAGHLDPDRSVVIAGGELAHRGDAVSDALKRHLLVDHDYLVQVFAYPQTRTVTVIRPRRRRCP